MCLNILNIFCILAFYIPLNVKVVFVRFYSFQSDHLAKSGNFLLCIKYIGYFINVLLAKSVFVAIFYKAFSSINHKNTFSVLGILLVNYYNSGRNSCTVKQVGRQTDKSFYISFLNE